MSLAFSLCSPLSAFFSLKGRRLVQDYLALFRTAVHANCPSSHQHRDLLDVLDDLLELPATHSVLENDVIHLVSVIVLLRLLRVGWVGSGASSSRILLQVLQVVFKQVLINPVKPMCITGSSSAMCPK